MDLSYLEEGGHDLIRKYINLLNCGDIYIDIGANSGYFSIIASKKVKDAGKVFSFEPSHREYSKLLANIKRNQCTNITPINLALGDNLNLTSINIAKEHTGLNKIMVNNQRIDSNDFNQNVLIMPLDLISNIFNEEIMLCKIDVEGFELFVLNGMKSLLKKGKISTLILEMSPNFLSNNMQSINHIYSLLKENGYISIEKNKSSGNQWDEVFKLLKEN